jgi:hypothetical protein
MPNPWKYPWALCLASYAVGLTLLFAWFVAGRLRIRQWIRSARPAMGERVLSVFRSALEGTQPASHRALLPFLSPLSGVEVLEGPGVPAPVSTGILHPRVLLPIGLADRLSDEELRAVALHEIAHLRRRDSLVLTLAALVRAVLFFHPLVWPAARQISALAEQCADDAVLETTGQAVPYARLLARLAEELPHCPLSAEMATGLLLGKSAFLRRVEAILSGRRLSLSRLALAGTLIAVLVSLVIALAVPLGEKKGPNSAPSEKAEWGKPVEGVQVRLRAMKTKWQSDERPELWADIRNDGKRELPVAATQNHCDLEMDGVWFRWAKGKSDEASSTLSPDREYDSILVELGGDWRSIDNNEGLKINEGKHKLRVAFVASPENNLTTQPIRIISNSFEIEIAAGPPPSNQQSRPVEGPQTEPTPPNASDSKSGDLEKRTAEPKDKPEALFPEPAVWITLFPSTPIRSLKEYRHTYRARSPAPEGIKIESCEFELRSGDGLRRIARFPYALAVGGGPLRDLLAPGKVFKSQGMGGSDALTESEQRRIGSLADGDYLVALIVNGVRCSNVAAFTVDSKFDPSREPTLKLFSLSGAPGAGLPYLGIRAIGPTPQDPKLTNMAVAFPEIFADGVKRERQSMTWVGPVGPLQPGKICTFILDIASNFAPAIEPGKAHEVYVKVGKYQSEPITISPGDPLGKTWDDKTLSPVASPPSIPSLRGKVTGPDGEPASGYDVTLFMAPDKRFKEQCNHEGLYEFFNIPSAKCGLSCSPNAQGRSRLRVLELQIEKGTTRTLDLDMQSRYSISGCVTNSDGKPAAGKDVRANWKSLEGDREWENAAITDADGCYLLGSPFPVAAWNSGQSPFSAAQSA